MITRQDLSWSTVAIVVTIILRSDPNPSLALRLFAAAAITVVFWRLA